MSHVLSNVIFDQMTHEFIPISNIDMILVFQCVGQFHMTTPLFNSSITKRNFST